jgi:hypothetical protein
MKLPLYEVIPTISALRHRPLIPYAYLQQHYQNKVSCIAVSKTNASFAIFLKLTW